MWVLAKDDYGEISKGKLHKDAYGAKDMKLNLSQQLFNLDDVIVDFYKESKIGDGICGMKMLKQILEGKTGYISRTPGRISRRC